MKAYRRERILSFLNENKAATIKELHSLFPEISLMTIHRDLQFLEEKGALVRVRGGAKSVERNLEPIFTARELENSAAKDHMAQKAVSLIKPGSSIFLDAGTSCLALARHLPDIEVSIFTNAPNIALELMRFQKPSINICGGNLNRANLSLSGHNTLEMLENINIDTAFIGVGGYTPQSGFTGGKENETLVKKLVISRSMKVVALMDTSKIGKVLPYTFAQLGDFDYIVDDGKLPEDFLRAAKEKQVNII
ncbi:MAG TPA: DeoR/GlpR family DNA-binding transcription regulator [Clostridiales bacterium]|jgi:DeoR/GlpR family transcriptional regulator of sugar metabolism|nr:DeoR/GlpR family DNA-binding transcription regulator [Clostridiales bacterium]